MNFSVVSLFPGDNLLTPLVRPRGLPIGNLTSQLWANTYLGGFDHWVKQTLGVSSYLRYVDDFALFGDERAQLAEWRDQLTRKLCELRLQPHPRKTVLQRTDEGLMFLGYVIRPHRIRVRGATLRRYRRRLRALRGEARTQSIHAWRGHRALVGRFRVARLRGGQQHG